MSITEIVVAYMLYAFIQAIIVMRIDNHKEIEILVVTMALAPFISLMLVADLLKGIVRWLVTVGK